jgi:hypothetical protein
VLQEIQELQAIQVLRVIQVLPAIQALMVDQVEQELLVTQVLAAPVVQEQTAHPEILVVADLQEILVELVEPETTAALVVQAAQEIMAQQETQVEQEITEL